MEDLYLLFVLKSLFYSLYFKFAAKINCPQACLSARKAWVWLEFAISPPIDQTHKDECVCLNACHPKDFNRFCPMTAGTGPSATLVQDTCLG